MPKIGNGYRIGGKRGRGFRFRCREAPTLLTLTEVTFTSFRLDWTTNSGGVEDGFSIERST